MIFSRSRSFSFFVLALLPLFSLWVSPFARAAVVLEQVKVESDGSVNLLFDKAVDKKLLQAEFVGDTIQLSLNEAAVYPSKMINVNNEWLTKVFAYQFSPRQVRCRFTVKGKAESFRSRFRFVTTDKSQKTLSVKIEAEPRSTVVGDKLEEEAPARAVFSDSTYEKASSTAVEKASPLASGKALPPIGTAFFKVMGVLSFLFALALFAKTMKGQDLSQKWASKLGWLTRGNKNFDGKMIEVLSTHYLGPKKGISLVRIAGRRFVLGVTDQSIHLITDMGDAKDGTRTEPGAVDFSSLLDTEKAAVNPAPIAAYQNTMAFNSASSSAFSSAMDSSNVDLRPQSQMKSNPLASNPNPNPKANSVRAQIRTRLENSKPL